MGSPRRAKGTIFLPGDQKKYRKRGDQTSFDRTGYLGGAAVERKGMNWSLRIGNFAKIKKGPERRAGH